MGFFARLATGWALTKDSVGVLRDDPELMAFPLVGSVAGLLYVALLLGGSYSVVGVDSGPVRWVVLFALYFGSTFLSSFATAGLMHETRIAFDGGEPSLRSGLEAAWRNKGTLLAWAAVAATVGVIIRMIDSQDNLLAQALAAIISVSWSILTYFVVPVIAFEDVSVLTAIRRSGETFKGTWGETAGAHFGVGLITFLLMLPVGLVAAAAVWLGTTGGGAFGLAGGIAVAAVLLIVAYLFSSTLGGIARAALYCYAAEGKRPSAFDDVDFDRAPGS